MAFLLFLMLVCSLWPASVSAAPSQRLMNPVCGPLRCDEFAARQECEDELSIAKNDPGLQPWSQQMICYNGHGRNSYNIVYPVTFQDANLNDYQNAFAYGVGFRSNLGHACCPVGDPVNAGTGNKYETRTEYQGSGIFPLVLAWTYNSIRDPLYHNKAADVFGRRRTHSFESRVDYFVGTTGTMAYVLRPDGRTIRFVDASGTWTTDRAGVGDLVSSSSGGMITGWTFFRADGGKEVYDATGRLLELYDAAGFKQVLSYDTGGRLLSVVDPNGRSLVFEYNTSNLVNKVNLPDGGALQFFYSTGGDLQQVQYPDGNSKQYLYDESAYVESGTPPGSLTGEVDESLQRFSTTTYSKSLYSPNQMAT